VSRGRRVRMRACKSSDGQLTLSALLCLIAALAQFSLPIAHVGCHLAEDGYMPVDIGCSLSGGRTYAALPRLAPSAEQASHRHHHHDPSSCPICQSFQHSSNFVVPHCVPTSCAPITVELLSCDHNGNNASGYTSGGGAPRAPPVSPKLRLHI
jgi:hypothetical protein